MSLLLDYIFTFTQYYFGNTKKDITTFKQRGNPPVINKQPMFFKNIYEKNPTNFYFLSLIKEESGWSIHGLWPQNSLDKYPQFCKEVEFDIRKLNPIMDQLKEHWYSNKGSYEHFWKHEYEKHGSCNFNNLNEFQYFEKTLELFYAAKKQQLPEYFYDDKSGKCLIPVTRKFDFFSTTQELVY